MQSFLVNVIAKIYFPSNIPVLLFVSTQHFPNLLLHEFHFGVLVNPLDTDIFCQLNVTEGGNRRGSAFYLNISKTIENRESCFCISNNDIQCVTKNHNRVGCTCLFCCLDDPKQIFFDFSEKCITSAL